MLIVQLLYRGVPRPPYRGRHEQSPQQGAPLPQLHEPQSQALQLRVSPSLLQSIHARPHAQPSQLHQNVQLQQAWHRLAWLSQAALPSQDAMVATTNQGPTTMTRAHHSQRTLVSAAILAVFNVDCTATVSWCSTDAVAWSA